MLICYVQLNFECNVLHAVCIRISFMTVDLVANALNIPYEDDTLIKSRLANLLEPK